MPTRRDPRLFDQKKPLAMARAVDLYDHRMAGGDPLTIVKKPSRDKGAVTLDVALRLWLSGVASYAEDIRPTPQETPEQEAERVVEVDELGGGWYLIRAPWLGEGEKVHGKDATEARRAEIVAKGDTKGVRVEGDGEGGWFEVTAPWLDEPEKVQGREAADARADELTAEGPPEGWVQLTPEEKEAKAEQARLLDEARAEAQRQADEAAERDRQEAADAAAAADADYLARATALGFTEEDWAAVDPSARDEALEKRAGENAARDAEVERLAAEQPKADADTAGTGTAQPGEKFEATAGRGGWFKITGPGIDPEAPVKVQGEAARDAKLAELAKAHTDAQPLTELAAHETLVGEDAAAEQAAQDEDAAAEEVAEEK